MSFLKNFKREQRQNCSKKKKDKKKEGFSDQDIEKAKQDFRNFKKYEMSKKPYKSNYVLGYDAKIYELYRQKFPEEVKKIEEELISRKPWLKNRQDLLYEQTNKIIFPNIILAGEQSTDKAPDRYVMSLEEVTFFKGHNGINQVYRKRTRSQIIPQGQRFNKSILDKITVEEAFSLLFDIISEDDKMEYIDEADVDERDVVSLIFRVDPFNMTYEEFCIQEGIHMDDLFTKMDEIKIRILKNYVEDDMLKKILNNKRSK